MNREIKFRVWDTHFSRFIKNIDFLSKGYWSCNGAPVFATEGDPDDYSDCEKCFEDTFILQQFTGLLDKNGKEIYESDILKSTRQNYDEELYLVEYLEDGFKKKRLVDCYTSPLGNSKDWLELQIIGNIFENSELLKQ
jgi:uncharacterized phage protein (TIGR01671 family)